MLGSTLYARENCRRTLGFTAGAMRDSGWHFIDDPCDHRLALVAAERRAVQPVVSRWHHTLHLRLNLRTADDRPRIAKVASRDPASDSAAGPGTPQSKTEA